MATASLGVNAAINRWGQVLQRYHATSRLAADYDLTSTFLGAWTGWE